MIPVTNAEQTDQAMKGALLFFFVYLMLKDAFEELWFPKAVFKLELSIISFYKICNHSNLNQQMVFHKVQ